MTVLTEKEQTLVRTVLITGVSTHRASLARVVGIHFDSHRTVQECFVGDHGLQLSKRPFGIGRIGLPLFLGRFRGLLAFRAIADICQIFQSNQTVWVSGHDTLGDDMIGVLLQPSLSSADRHKATGCRTSAFFLKTLSQSRVVVGFWDNLLPRMEGLLSSCCAAHSQVANTYIHACHCSVAFGGWVSYLNLKTDQQGELLLLLVVPEFGRTNFSSLLWGLVQPFVAFLGQTGEAFFGILLDLRPQGFVGRSHLAGNATGHLGRQMKMGANLIIGSILQCDSVTHLAMLKSVLTDRVQGIPIRQLRRAQGFELLSIRMQFEFGCYHRFHISSLSHSSTACQGEKTGEYRTLP